MKDLVQRYLAEVSAQWKTGAKIVECVKDPIVDNWFDVEPVATFEKLTIVDVIKTGCPLADRKAIKKRFAAFGVVRNEHDGRNLVFPAKSVGKMLGQKGLNLYEFAGSFDELFRKSRRLWSETEAEIAGHIRHRNIKPTINMSQSFRLMVKFVMYVSP